MEFGWGIYLLEMVDFQRLEGAPEEAEDEGVGS